MREVIIVASLLGVTGVAASFLLFIIGLDVLHLSALTLQTLMFLKMMVAGHMTLYLARTHNRHFWERPFPAGKLLIAAEGTQVFATVLAVYGVLISPIGWWLAGFVWGYALLEFIVTDFLKIRYFRTFENDGKEQKLRDTHSCFAII